VLQATAVSVTVNTAHNHKSKKNQQTEEKHSQNPRKRKRKKKKKKSNVSEIDTSHHSRANVPRESTAPDHETGSASVSVNSADV